jgi:transcription initiation factor TFIID TATA-box-binding protein
MVITMEQKENYTVTNLVASTDLGLTLDLYELTTNFKNIEYEPEQFPGAILKFTEPKATILIFKNGKIVCVGCRTRELIAKAIRKVYGLLKPYSTETRKKYDLEDPKYDLTNIVASADLHMDLDLFKVATMLPDIEYEPEQFPGAIIKLRDLGVSLLAFKNGKIIIAGAKSLDKIEKAIKEIRRMLKTTL